MPRPASPSLHRCRPCLNLQLLRRRCPFVHHCPAAASLFLSRRRPILPKPRRCISTPPPFIKCPAHTGPSADAKPTSRRRASQIGTIAMPPTPRRTSQQRRDLLYGVAALTLPSLHPPPLKTSPFIAAINLQS
ncbi:hypothetical protein M0R45_007969 [Rubus argutus]|uniref:Uncharacterized protein n=1 Tax=Rubus argutus TaxID=59490 RepID=A0AAW1Y1F3_RUBAR